MRINKLLSTIGYCSRRQADQLIKQQRVTVNHQVAQLGQMATIHDQLSIDGKLVSTQPAKLAYSLL